MQRSVTNSSTILKTEEHSTYLGMLIVVGRRKTTVFDFVRKNVQNKIARWKGRFLSKVGKVVMLKTMAQAIPNYIISLFLLPQDICDDVEKMMNAFFMGKL